MHIYTPHIWMSPNAARLASAATNSSHSILLRGTSTKYRNIVLSAPLVRDFTHVSKGKKKIHRVEEYAQNE